MDRDQARDYIKSQLEDYLSSQGINTSKAFTCKNPTHPDHNPSMGYDQNNNRVKCFSCHSTYDTLDLIGIDYGLTDYNDMLKKGCELYRITLDGKREAAPKIKKPEQGAQHTHYTQHTQEEPKKDYSEYYEKCYQRISQTDYFQNRRGLSPAVIDRFKLGYDPKCELFSKEGKPYYWDAVIIPTSKHTHIARNIKSDIQKNKVRKVNGSVVFNSESLWSGKPVFVVEGEIDAMSIVEVGGEAVGLGGISNVPQFINILKEKRPTNTLILSLDNDERGIKATDELKRGLQALNIPFIQAEIVWGKIKDPNEALTSDRAMFKHRVQLAILKAEDYVPNALDAQEVQEVQEENVLEKYKSKNNAKYHLQSFIDGISDDANTACIPTGFKNLDKVLEGGLYEGLYAIGAISSLGKTTMVLQIADQIAQSGNDILIFSLEMARTELMAKSISRLTFELTNNPRLAKTTRGITVKARREHYSQEEVNLITQAIGAYAGYSENIYIYEGVGNMGTKDIREHIEKHISITGNKPVVIIDYLQLMEAQDPRMTDKQNVDKAVLELKRITRDNKIPIIAISSFNRSKYNAPASMEAFKESGAIEYSSDVLIGLQLKGAGSNNFDVDQAKQRDPREIEAKILKNRNGATGGTIEYEYYPLFNYYSEV